MTTTSDSGTEYAAPKGMSRRVVMTGAAWSMPAIAMMTSSPAFAVSSQLLTVSSPNNQLPAAGAVTVSAVLNNSSGSPVAGAVVSFSGPSGATFSPASAVTNSSGTATTSMNLGTPWATPGSTVTVSAVSGSETKSQPLTVLGSNVVAAGRGYSSTPAQTELVFPSPVLDVAADLSTFLVLLKNGTVWAKGTNTYGQLGDGTTTDRSTWAQVAGLSGVTQIAVAQGTSYALLSDGSVRAWGYNGDGEVGDGTTTSRLTPTAVSGLSGVTQIAAGYATGYALSSSGSLKAWGWNGSGAVGDGTTTSRLTPTQVSGLTAGVTQVVGGASGTGYALLSDGSVRAWGYNRDGEIGDGTTTNRLTPTAVSGLSGGVKQIAAGVWAAYALLTDASIRAWGDNYYGELGDGTTTTRLTPVQAVASGVTQLSASARSVSALLSNGSVRVWGANGQNQLGDGTSTNRPTPQSFTVPSGGATQKLPTSNSSNGFTTLVLTTNS